MFDVTSFDSFENVQSWRDEFMSQALINESDDFPMILLGNKSDLGEKRVREHGVAFFDTVLRGKWKYLDLLCLKLKKMYFGCEYDKPLIRCANSLPRRSLDWLQNDFRDNSANIYEDREEREFRRHAHRHAFSLWCWHQVGVVH